MRVSACGATVYQARHQGWECSGMRARAEERFSRLARSTRSGAPGAGSPVSGTRSACVRAVEDPIPVRSRHFGQDRACPNVFRAQKNSLVSIPQPLCRLDLTGRLLLLPLAEPMGEVKGLFTIEFYRLFLVSQPSIRSQASKALAQSSTGRPFCSIPKPCSPCS